MAGATFLVLVSGWVSSGWGAYLAVGLAVVFGGILALGWAPGKLRDSRVVVDSLIVSLLVFGTGGEGSPLWPLYFLAASGIVWASGRMWGVLGSGVTVGGYAGVALLSGAEASSPRIWLEAGVILLACGIASVARAEIQRLKSEREDGSRDLADERAYREKVEAITAHFEPPLGMLSLEGVLEWAAGAAREATGADYAHAVIMDGNHHRTSAGDEHDSYPSWWHPEVQRLALWSYRENGVRRGEGSITGQKEIVAVPVAPEGKEPLGVILAWGSGIGAAGERALRLLSERVASALEMAAEAPGGRDAVSGLPSYASLERRLKRELSREAVVTVVAADLDEFRRYNRAYSTAEGDVLLRKIGDRLMEGSVTAFRCGGDEFALVLRGGSHVRARKAALRVREIVADLTADSAAPLSVTTGFTVSGSGESRSGSEASLLDVALLAVSRAKQARAAGHGAGRDPVYVSAEELEQARHETRTMKQTPWMALSLAEATEVRMPALGAHLRAVSHLAALIGEEMGLSSEDLDALKMGGLLHDVGKIGLPDSILLKAGPLSVEEYQLMKHHPAMGGKVVEKVPELSSILPVVMHHHERFDGMGYPAGLAGEEIPLAARVVAVADAFDSMVRNRPYRQRLTTQEALEETLRHAGTQFDPQSARALERVIRRDDWRIAN